MLVRKNTATLFFLSLSGIIFGQANADTLKTSSVEEVIVTATRTERSVATLPLPTQIISGESIRKSGVSRLNEIIQEQTGLITVPDFGGGEGIQMQGLDAAYVMILLDGQPMFGRSAGTLDLSRISVNNIERIEIVKGASSCLYGSEALAGVINIITKKPQISEKLKGNFNYKIATFNTHDASANLELGKNKIGGELFANFFSSGGYNLSNDAFLNTVEPYRNFTIQPKLKINFSGKVNLSASTRFFRQNQDYKARIEGQEMAGESQINEWNHALLVNHQATEKLKIVYDLYATHYLADEYLNQNSGQIFEESRFDQWFFRPEIRSHYRLGKNTISAGVGMNYESLDRTYFADRAVLNSEYFFGQFEWFLKEKWNILAGFRYDHHHQYESQLSPKLGINYKWNDHFSLKASVGYGYKAPDLRQLYFNFTNSAVGYTVLGYNVAAEKLALLDSQGQISSVENIDFSSPLKPESSVNFNFGGYYKKEKFSFDYNLFYNRITDLIDTKVIAAKPSGQNVFSYLNLDEIFTYGAEINSSYRFNSNFTVSAGYQYLIAKDQEMVERLKNGEIFARNPSTLETFQLRPSDYFGLLNRSKHTANLKVNYTIKSLGTSINARLFYRSKYGMRDSNSSLILDRYDEFVKGYFTANLTVNQEFRYGISAQLGALNLFNYKDAANIPNLPGRQFFGRIQYQF